MRHGRSGFKLKRDISARRALLRSLVTSAIIDERIQTTGPKAKAARPIVEKMITLAKKDTPAAREQASHYMMTQESVAKLFDKIGPRFAQRNGGYTRLIPLRNRIGDGAEVVLLELVGSELVKRAADKAKRKEERLRQQGEGQGGGAQ